MVISYFSVKMAIVALSVGTGLSLLPWLRHWLGRPGRSEILHPAGWFQRTPHILLLVHSGMVVLLLLNINPLPFLSSALITSGGEAGLFHASAGLMLFALGNAIRVAGMYALGTGLEKDVMVFAGQELRTDGPYAVSRHPIYTGNMMAELGLGLALGYWPLVVFTLVLSIPCWNIRARREERMLAEFYGPRYEQYARTVGRFWPSW